MSKKETKQTKKIMFLYTLHDIVIKIFYVSTKFMIYLMVRFLCVYIEIHTYGKADIQAE